MAETPDDSRFISHSDTAEDRLKADTYGLVQLSDFRKRALEAQETSATTSDDGRDSTAKNAFKKRKKNVKKGGLSFGDEGEEDSSGASALDSTTAATNSSKDVPKGTTDSDATSDAPVAITKKRSLRPNAAVSLQPRAMTKAALLRETQLKDALKREYAQIQEAVKATEIMVPFVFYDSKNMPGGRCRMKKGDPIWLFLERARKLGADLADKSRRDWARISVDDLMVVKGEIIISHHYDFHYFLLNGTVGYHGPLFTYSAQPTSTTPAQLLAPKLETGSSTPEPARVSANNLQTASQRKQQAAAVVGPDDSELEGFDDDPNLTKVVDRRWYERNKHIYPASSWEEFDASKDYTKGVRKDTGGNSMFFSR